MKATCNDIAQAMERYAPRFLQEGWDNTGLLVGYGGKEVSKVLVALDLSDNVADEAVSADADMIVSHHPVIFKGISQISDSGALGRRLLKLIQNNISVYAAHTNLDVAEGGTNDRLFDVLGLINRESLQPPADDRYAYGCGRVGDLPEAMPLECFAAFVKKMIGAPFVTYAGRDDTTVKRVALCTGACANADFFKLALQKNADVYVTGDVTHHTAQAALDVSLCLVDATHYYTEALINDVLAAYLTRYFSENGFETRVCVSQVNGQLMKLV